MQDCFCQNILIILISSSILHLPVGQMNGKKGSGYMEKAIDKASKLIDLLTKQNEDLKQQNIRLQNYADKLEDISRTQRLRKEHNDESISNLMKQNKEKSAKIKELEDQMQNIKEKLQDKANKNKHLHQKLGEFASKNQQLQKTIQKERKKNLSLQNENEYLVKTFTAYELKENQFQNYCFLAEEEFKKQVFMIDRTKQAYSKKCEELKLQNCSLQKEVVDLASKLKQAELREAELLGCKQKMIDLQKQIKRANDVLAFLIQSTIRIKPQGSLCLKIDQLKNYLTYRMQHIQNLIKPITDIVGGTSIRQIRDLQSLGTIVNRLASYIGELLK